MTRKILVVAAHPDDEVLGCGATLAREASEGACIRVVLVATGASSRFEAEQDSSAQVEALAAEAREANRILGIDDVVFGGYPDQMLDTLPILDLVTFVRTHVQEFQPDVVYTHYANDYNPDHGVVCRAVVAATRPALSEHHPDQLYCFEVLSSTEWQPDGGFVPHRYVDVKDSIEIKGRALAAYASELRDYPHPRSIEGVEVLAKKRGLEISRAYAEAFHVLRLIDVP
jgi:LmbE family N-acetylglucosaminyl deacetylase